jgi:hypothetical protein
MRVRSHLRLQLGIIRGRRFLLMAAVAVAFVWIFPEHSPNMVKRLLMFAAVVLSLWLVATVLGLPKPSPRCPRCAHKVSLRRRVTSCPTCNVTFDARVKRDWRHVPTPQSPWITRPQSLRLGQLERR